MQSTAPGSSDARRAITVASVSLAAVLIGAAFLLRRLTHGQQPLFQHDHALVRAAIGAVIGAVIASINALLVSRLHVFERISHLAHHAVEGIEPRWHTVVIVALAAGFGEEIFFRGALDPVLGQWLTGLAFVALHGALRIRNRNHLMFAGFLYAASIGLSALNRWQGLECAIAAHSAYDLAMLVWLVRGAMREPTNN